jgi:hypothetical protein
MFTTGLRANVLTIEVTMFPIIKTGIIWKWVINRFEREVAGRPLASWGFSCKGTTVVFDAAGGVSVATESRLGLLNFRLVVFGNVSQPAREQQALGKPANPARTMRD